MINWLVQHLTLPYVLTLVVGLLLGYGINWFVCWRKFKNDPTAGRAGRDGFTTIVGLIIVIAMVWIMVSVTQARNCAIQLNVSTSAETAAAKIERDAFEGAIAKSLAAPAEIRALPQNDPAYQAYMKPIQTEYLTALAKANDMRKRNETVQSAAAKACGTG